jgi:hypothetical protein
MVIGKLSAFSYQPSAFTLQLSAISREGELSHILSRKPGKLILRIHEDKRKVFIAFG